LAQQKPEPARAWHYEPVTENYFVGSIASEYETKWPHLFDPADVDPAVDFLAAYAGAGPRPRARHRDGAPGAAAEPASPAAGSHFGYRHPGRSATGWGRRPPGT
jgi:hypothetical protein